MNQAESFWINDFRLKYFFSDPASSCAEQESTCCASANTVRFFVNLSKSPQEKIIVVLLHRACKIVRIYSIWLKKKGGHSSSSKSQCPVVLLSCSSLLDKIQGQIRGRMQGSIQGWIQDKIQDQNIKGSTLAWLQGLKENKNPLLRPTLDSLPL